MARLDTEVIKEWLKQELIPLDDGLNFSSGRVPDMPDRMVTVIRGTGRGKSLDGLFEEVSYLVLSRGGQNNLDDAEEIAKLVDRVMLNRFTNLNFMDCRILKTDWAGSGPNQEPASDRQSRFSFVCSYSIESSME